VLFSEPKIPQFAETISGDRSWYTRFSALQRAENSSMMYATLAQIKAYLFQCSSASRKFLNLAFRNDDLARRARFSALQRAENSSIVPPINAPAGAERFQCSSASRKFLNGCGSI